MKTRSTMEEWDALIAPLLFIISSDAFWIKQAAGRVLENCKTILRTPEWSATAEVELNEAITALSEGLDILKEALVVYKGKGTEM